MTDRAYIVTFDRLGQRGHHSVRFVAADVVELEEKITTHALVYVPEDDIEVDVVAGRVHGGADTSYGTFMVEAGDER